MGYVQVYTGDGKGKTTAALGLAIRAIAHGFSVIIIQFLKGGTFIGEKLITSQLPQLKIKQFGKDCPYSEKMALGLIKCAGCRDCFLRRGEDEELVKQGIEFAKDATRSGKYDVVILDEINIAISSGLVKVDKVLDLIKNKNKNTELVITGRNAPKEIIDAADIVTEMKEKKHILMKGISGRVGIEY
jgi:cob(I)alamin adenosyltransferase